jgi:MFS family permease
MVGSFATGANIRLVDVVLPQIAEEFTVSIGLVAQVATAYAFGYGMMQIVLGIAGDRFGKIRLVAVLCFASVIACLLRRPHSHSAS